MNFSNLGWFLKNILLNTKKGERISRLPYYLHFPALIFRNTLLALKTLLKDILPLPYNHSSDGMKTIHNTGFMDSQVFINSNKRAQKSRGFYLKPSKNIPWRIHQLIWAGSHCIKLKGDFVECGTGKGVCMSALLESLPNWNNSGKKIWLFDTFSPLMINEEGERIDRINKGYASSYSDTVKNFSDFSNVNVIEGLLPETLTKLTSNEIAFLHLDLNHAEPEVATLKELWPRITDGGIIILDDYAWLGRERQYIAMNKLSKEFGFSILTTPTGQGIIIKQN